MVYFGVFIRQIISFSHFTQYTILLKMKFIVLALFKNGTSANQRNQLQLFHKIISGCSLKNL